ncbi:hypothetical protein EHQ76_06020 [Leptospira barantonii]|uniref:Alginate export domain-containing protein n=1 Tax=Leptospira barantonii TaxID=2023184 RepID=A0A5F2BL26_9LEPT|nr:hypothetical protein [Leptospira barantonii]TGM06289.1 hypothetical protein EHQ76_06020 [Leptospira barantonii]
MKRIFVYSVFLMCFSVSAKEKSNGWTGVSWMGWGLGTNEKTQSVPQQKEKPQFQETRMNSSLFHGEVDHDFHSSHLNWKVQADLSVLPESRVSFFAGKNLFFEFKKENVSLYLGRVQEDLKTSSFRDWLDGCDGVVLKADFQKQGRVRLDLFDFYSGYSLFERNVLKDTILNTKRIESNSAGEIETRNSFPKTFRNRYRGGVTYKFDLPYLETGFRFQYLNLQNWGRFSNDLGAETGTVSSGDRDYLIHSSLELNTKFSWFYGCFTGILARGQDKTGWNRVRNASTIPITGEAVLLTLGASQNFWRFEVFGFLPNRDKRSENGEVLELGFIGMGSSPSPVFSTNQSLDFFPSAWITDKGLEKQSSVQSGKRQSAWTGINLEYHQSLLRFRFYAASYFFLKDFEGNSGALTISRNGFRKESLKEAMLQALIYFPSETARFQFSYLKVSLGGSWSDSETAKKEVFFQLGAGVIL